AIAAVRSAASSAVWAIGPMVSSVPDNGTAPYRLIKPYVVLSPVSPHSPDVMRPHHPLSVPRAAGVRPAAVATAEPQLDPPATRWTDVSHGFHGAPIGSVATPPPHGDTQRSGVVCTRH